MESDSEDDTYVGVTVTTEPPIEDPTTIITDCDLDESIDEVTCNPDYLPIRIPDYLFTILLSKVSTEKENDKSCKNAASEAKKNRVQAK